jgi:EAL domain-containing protein (putative c-di-GMP-specific phosphodiesterase class I)
MSDEFMILDLYGSDSRSMEQLYQQICFRVEASVAKQHYKALYTISAGLLRLRDIAPDARGDYVEAMKLSEFALSEAKNRGKNRMYSYRSEDYTAFLRKRHIRTNMSQALSDNYKGFEVYYQPIINPQLGSLYAAEALLRFHSPSGETTGPSEFVPVLEESGLIVPVGKWIIRQALDMCRKVRTVYPDFKVSVNLSYIQIMKFPLYEEVMAALEEAGLPPSSLIVEMTESGQLEGDSAARDIWRKLKASGVNIALDDFGTGYSNLTNIGDLRPDYLKIDHVFTTRALRSEYEFELLRHVVNMAHSIGLNLVVEGVETLDELIRILQLNPDFIQGFFYCSPCPRAEFFTKYHI